MEIKRPAKDQQSQTLKDLLKEPTVRITVDVPETLHLELKTSAMLEKTSMSSLIIEMIRKYSKEFKAKQSAKERQLLKEKEELKKK